MLLFALISVLNLCLGFAFAVALGYGPRPWWGIFADAGSAGAVRIEKLEEDFPPLSDRSPSERSIAEDEDEDVDDEFDDDPDADADDELPDDAEEDEVEEVQSKAKLARLQEIKADKLAKRMEAEQLRAREQSGKLPAQPAAPVPPPVAPAEPIAADEDQSPAEEDPFDVAGIISDDLAALIEEEPIQELADEPLAVSAPPSIAADEDVDGSLDEIESLLKAAGQLEADIAADSEWPEDAAAAGEELTSAAVASAEEAAAVDQELTSDEIEAMFKRP